MNFQTILEELDRLYEEMPAAEAPVEQEDAVLEEAAEEDVIEEEADEEIEIVDDEEVATKLVLECGNCGAVVIKADDEVVVDEETSVANVDEACKFCEAAVGYKVIGTFTPYEDEQEGEEADEAQEEVEEIPAEDEQVVEEEPVEEPAEEQVEDSTEEE